MSQQVNLFNPAFEQKKQMFGALAMAQALALLAAGCALLAFYGNQHVRELRAAASAGELRVLQAKDRLAAVERDFPAKKKSAALEAELAQAHTQLDALRRVGDVIERGELGNSEGYSRYFLALARRRTEGVWLTGMQVAGGGAIEVRGRATDAALLPPFLAQLQREPVMQGKTFGSVQIKAPEPGTEQGGAAKPAAPGYVEFTLSSEPAQAEEEKEKARP